MFGGGGIGGGGMGGGYRNPRIRYIRLGLLVAVVLAGIAFGHSGRGYELIRTIYIVAVVGLLLYSFSRRRAHMRNLPGGGAGGGLPGGGRPGAGTWPGTTATPFPGDTLDVRTVPNNPAPTFGQTPGWFPDPSDATLERYWDGSNWSESRARQGGPSSS